MSDEKKTMILGVGSMGCTTVVQWLKNGYIEEQLNKVCLVHNDSRSLIKYHNDIKKDIKEWCLDISDLLYSDKVNRDYQVKLLNEYICAWMNSFAKVNRMIIVAGLGKTMGSVAVPMMLKTARDLGIETVTMCVTPFELEGEMTKQRAEMILPLIKQLSTVTYYSDNKDLEVMSEESMRTMPEILDMVNYGFAFVVGSIQKEYVLSKYTCRMYIRKDNITGDIHFEEQPLEVSDNYDVIETICGLIDTWPKKEGSRFDYIKSDNQREKESLIEQYRLQQQKEADVQEKTSINPQLLADRQGILCAIMGFVVGRGYVADERFEESIIKYVINRNLSDAELMTEACMIIDTAVNRKWLYGKRFDAMAAVVTNGCDFKAAI